MEIGEKVKRWIKKPAVYTSILAGVLGILIFRLWRALPRPVAATVFLQAIRSKLVLEIKDYGWFIVFKTAAGWSRTRPDNISKSWLLTHASQTSVEYSSHLALQYCLELVCKLGLLSLPLAVAVYLQRPTKPPTKALQHPATVRFASIAGNEKAKEALTDVIQFFKAPERFRQLGAQLPRGVLLYGPSGTGKTMLAKAVAAESGVNFLHSSGSEFVEVYVGVGARRIRDLFAQARANAPCVVFIDEIDSLAPKRTSEADRTHMEHHSTINQLLSEMDGFVESTNIVVLGATNRYEIMDEAVLRPGRFDRKIEVELPTAAVRLEILQMHLKGRAHAVSAEALQRIVAQTEQFNGAELAALANEAAFKCVREDRTALVEADLIEALQNLVKSKQAYAQHRMYRHAYKA